MQATFSELRHCLKERLRRHIHMPPQVFHMDLRNNQVSNVGKKGRAYLPKRITYVPR